MVVLTSCAGIEILVRVAGKIPKAFYLILYSMRVDKVHNHSYTLLVCSVNESLQLFWSAET